LKHVSLFGIVFVRGVFFPFYGRARKESRQSPTFNCRVFGENERSVPCRNSARTIFTLVLVVVAFHTFFSPAVHSRMKLQEDHRKINRPVGIVDVSVSGDCRIEECKTVEQRLNGFVSRLRIRRRLVSVSVTSSRSQCCTVILFASNACVVHARVYYFEYNTLATIAHKTNVQTTTIFSYNVWLMFRVSETRLVSFTLGTGVHLSVVLESVTCSLSFPFADSQRGP